MPSLQECVQALIQAESQEAISHAQKVLIDQLTKELQPGDAVAFTQICGHLFLANPAAHDLQQTGEAEYQFRERFLPVLPHLQSLLQNGSNSLARGLFGSFYSERASSLSDVEKDLMAPVLALIEHKPLSQHASELSVFQEGIFKSGQSKGFFSKAGLLFSSKARAGHIPQAPHRPLPGAKDRQSIAARSN